MPVSLSGGVRVYGPVYAEDRQMDIRVVVDVLARVDDRSRGIICLAAESIDNDGRFFQPDQRAVISLRALNPLRGEHEETIVEIRFLSLRQVVVHEPDRGLLTEFGALGIEQAGDLRLHARQGELQQAVGLGLAVDLQKPLFQCGGLVRLPERSADDQQGEEGQDDGELFFHACSFHLYPRPRTFSKQAAASGPIFSRRRVRVTGTVRVLPGVELMPHTRSRSSSWAMMRFGWVRK